MAGSRLRTQFYLDTFDFEESEENQKGGDTVSGTEMIWTDRFSPTGPANTAVNWLSHFPSMLLLTEL